MQSKAATSRVSVADRVPSFVPFNDEMVKLARAAGRRMKGVQVMKPIVYGSIAQRVDTDWNEHTHQWTVYLKSYDNEDMSVYIKRVLFKLDDTYANPIRVCNSPPYEVTETGWGEFEIIIKVLFQDSNEKPLTIRHFLSLFERRILKMGSNLPVESEVYDEIVFQDPTVKMHRLLSNPKNDGLQSPQPHIVNYEKKKKQDLEKILKGKKMVKDQVADLKARLVEAKENITQLKNKLAKEG